MPLNLNVGISRKIGEANYGSRGASVNLELELESSLVESPERLQERIKQFRLAKESVDEELGAGSSQPQSNGHGDSHGQGRSRARPATRSQVRALLAIAERQGLNLEQTVYDRFGRSRAEDLTISQASQLIDELNARTEAGGRA